MLQEVAGKSGTKYHQKYHQRCPENGATLPLLKISKSLVEWKELGLLVSLAAEYSLHR
jgi:hypothetical protein